MKNATQNAFNRYFLNTVLEASQDIESDYQEGLNNYINNDLIKHQEAKNWKFSIRIIERERKQQISIRQNYLDEFNGSRFQIQRLNSIDVRIKMLKDIIENFKIKSC